MSKATPTKKLKGERLRESERIVLSLGLGISIFGALCLGMVMFGLSHYADSTEDASAKTLSPVIAPDYPRRLIDFSLTDQNGRTINRSELNGSFLVVGFIFTSCSITCPVVTHQMEQIQALTANQPDVRLVSLTVDPEDDTVEVLKNYSTRFGADPRRWSFLTGDEAVSRSLIGTSFLPRDTSSAYAYMPGNFAHIERIALVDPQGRVQKYFNGLDEGAADAVVAEIKRLRGTLE
jgi:cytochrome oxidase Cu insertion factor (SCO1/SenC/PrrC family)